MSGLKRVGELVGKAVAAALQSAPPVGLMWFGPVPFRRTGGVR